MNDPKMASLVLGLMLIILFSGCSSKEKVNLSSSAFMYNANQTIEKEVQVVLTGYFSDQQNSFEGKLRINHLEYPHILFMPGTALISYEGEHRTVLGQMYYDKVTRHYAIEIHHQDLYAKLTDNQPPALPLILSSPASNLEQAQKIKAAFQP
jgi:hypothetical protein